MEILSTEQYGAFTAGRIPGVEEFAEGTWSVPMGLPTEFPGGVQAYSFAYVLDDFSGGLHVVDPGWDTEANISRWEQFLSSLGRGFGDVATITATHLHHDHLGLAAELSRRSGAPLVMSEAEAGVLDAAAAALGEADTAEANRVSREYAVMTPERLKEFGVPQDRWEELLWVPREPAFPVADHRIRGGERLPISGREILAVDTPGHTGGHLCLVDDATQTLFTADHVLPGINSGLGLGGTSPTNPIGDYFASLERITPYSSYAVAPGHEYRFGGLARRIQELRDHHLRRSREVAREMGEHHSIWEIAKRVTWSDGFANLTSYRLGSALSQVYMHREFVIHGGLDRA